MKYVDLPHSKAALAIFPSVVGFGWAVFDGPLAPVAWKVCYGAKASKGSAAKNEKCVVKAERLLAKYRPATLVLEAFEGPGTGRAVRIKELCRSLISAATMQGVKVRIITRTQIMACFASRNPRTREDVVGIVVEFMEELKSREPEKRKIWRGEEPDVAMFNAAALLIVHYANPREPL
jgi:hypothetical protein